MQNSQIPGPQRLAIPEGCERSQGESGSPRAQRQCPSAQPIETRKNRRKMHMGEGWTGGQEELRKQMRLRVKKTN